MSATSLTQVAGIIGDAARSDMLMALLPGQALTAGELSMRAGVSAQNASGHLQKLLQANLVSIEVQGRHRYYRLATPDVAHALESLAAISSSVSFHRNESPQLAEVRFCRSCYDHLAGKVAVEIASSLLGRGLIEENGREFAVTKSGARFFQNWGIELRSLRSLRRKFAIRCLDWTERRPHISGALGAAILSRCQELKWIAPIRGSRALRLTLAGQQNLPRCFRCKL